MATTQDLMNLISRMEGFGIGGSVATRNNNPGNLRYAGQAGAVSTDASGFAVFGTPDEGWSALKRQIELDANRQLSIREFINKYAPPSENNTSNYLSFITDGLGLSADTNLASFVFNGGAGSGSHTNTVTDFVPGFDDVPGLDLGEFDLSYNSPGLNYMAILIGVAAVGVIMYAS